MTSPASDLDRHRIRERPSPKRGRFRNLAIGGLLVAGVFLAAYAGFVTLRGGDSRASDQPGEGRGESAPADVPSRLSSVVPRVTGARDFYAAPTGKATSDGSIKNPFDLATALSSSGPVAPGDTLWLRGGTYKGPFKSTLMGANDAPIFVRRYPGERAVIDSGSTGEPALTVGGGWTWYWGLEFFDSGSQRTTREDGARPKDLMRGTGIVASASNVRFINLVMHDLAGGIHVGEGAANVEIYGSILYHNGWQGPTVPRGAGVEVFLPKTAVYLRDNIAFRQFGSGIQVRSGRDEHVFLEGNIVYDSGDLAPQRAANLLLAGGHLHLLNNHTNFSSGDRRGGSNIVGYDAGCSSVDARENYWVNAAGYPLELSKCEGTIASNVIAGVFDDALTSRFRDNSYHRSGRPPGFKTLVLPNSYETGRAHIVIHNWDRVNAVRINLAEAGLKPGVAYEIRNVQNLSADPVAAGVYDGGLLSLRLGVVTPAQVIGDVPTPTIEDPREFGVFLVVPRVAGTGAR